MRPLTAAIFECNQGYEFFVGQRRLQNRGCAVRISLAHLFLAFANLTQLVGHLVYFEEAAFENLQFWGKTLRHKLLVTRLAYAYTCLLVLMLILKIMGLIFALFLNQSLAGVTTLWFTNLLENLFLL